MSIYTLSDDILSIILDLLNPVDYLSFVSSFGSVFRFFNHLQVESKTTCVKMNKFVPYQLDIESRFIYNVIEYMAKTENKEFFEKESAREFISSKDVIDIAINNGMFEFFRSHLRLPKLLQEFEFEKALVTNKDNHREYWHQLEQHTIRTQKVNDDMIRAMVTRGYEPLIKNMEELSIYCGIQIDPMSVIVHECVTNNRRHFWSLLTPHLLDNYHSIQCYLYKYSRLDGVDLFWKTEYDTLFPQE